MKSTWLFRWILMTTLLITSPGFAQGVGTFVHEASNGYEYPEDAAVLEKLEQWKDRKFGVLFHWGLYSIPGIVESWSICSEDVDWISRNEQLPYAQYKAWYYGLANSFNPQDFDPEEWARIMAQAGMKYMIFTSKHHDGFCMFDSQYTDFSIAKGPFSSHERSNVAYHVWEAFRQEDFMIGCYFSKPDWHSQWYWHPHYATPNRRHNYKIERHPDWWKNYQDFTENQLNELMRDYGHFDILWLDGGWVRGEDVHLDRVLEKARQNHPGLIAVDRTIKGKNENYQTPERGIPQQQLDYPWESCIPLSNDWGWVPNAPYKSANTVINLLSEITAKGGCFLLGIGPDADGRIEPAIVERLQTVGDWLKRNGAAIYNTRNARYYQDDKIWFTADKNGTTLYAIYTLPDGETLPKTLQWRHNLPTGKVRLLNTNKTVRYKIKDGIVTLQLPSDLKQEPLAFEFTCQEPQPLYKDPSANIEDRVQDLLTRMTLEEKIGQLSCLMGWEMYNKVSDSQVEVSDAFRQLMDSPIPIGSFWAVLRADPWTRKTLTNGLNPKLAAMTLNQLQRYAIENTRLGIPLFFAEETPHGHMAIGTTVFPTGLGMASTWNEALLQSVGEAVALEARLQGSNIGFGPVLDLSRDPRWSRMEESFGEDPTLSALLGTAYMKGMQGNDPSDGRHLYSTIKHFAAYGLPEGGHNGAEATLGSNRLFSDYLAPVKMAVENGAASIMTAYNSIDGVPCTANHYLLTDVLRKEWGFEGLVLSDLFSIDGLRGTHRVANSLQEAGKMALEAGVDLDLGGNAYGKRLLQLVEQGGIDPAIIDRSVARVLRMKFQMGLFENPYVDPQLAEQQVRSQNHINLSRAAAAQSTVLLKNDGILPLSKSIQSIAVIGPNADTPYNQLGDYTAPQDDSWVTTPLEGIQNAVSKNTRVSYVKGCAIREVRTSNIPEAVAAAQAAEVTVLVVGGSSARDFKTEYIETGAATLQSPTSNQLLADMDCGEGYDRCTLDLLGDQEALLTALLETGKPLVVVYIQGRPLNMNLAAEKANALLTAWYPGAEGGNGLADVLFGDYNPSGRLPISIPRHVGQLPVHYSRTNRGQYIDGSADALYPFGFGLSYTQFEYSDLVINGPNSISCTITNTGDRAGHEIVQLYVREQDAGVSQPPLELKAFQRIHLQPGESKTVTFEQAISPCTVKIWIGASSKDLHLNQTF